MENQIIPISRLKEPFPASDITWRVGRSGIKEGKPWAMVLAYLDARAVQERLDEVFGMLGWQDAYTETESGIICILKVWDEVEKEWITKSDGAPKTDVEAFKGGISNAFKRAASSGLGVGRYLYALPKTWAVFTENGAYNSKIKENKDDAGKWFKWNPPELPKEALPKGVKTQSKPKNKKAPKSQQNGKSKEFDRTAKLGFTKEHKDKTWEKVDDGLLQWFLKNLDDGDPNITFAQLEIDARKNGKDEKPKAKKPEAESKTDPQWEIAHNRLIIAARGLYGEEEIQGVQKWEGELHLRVQKKWGVKKVDEMTVEQMNEATDALRHEIQEELEMINT